MRGPKENRELLCPAMQCIARGGTAGQWLYQPKHSSDATIHRLNQLLIDSPMVSPISYHVIYIY